MSDLLWPVFEFRPILLGFGDLYRYADGAWIPDDGEHDVAFFGASIAYYVHLPHQRNIVWSWIDGHWTDNDARHPRRNPWHYALRDGETQWGGAWGVDQHPNTVAGRKAMNACCSRFSCANGRGPDVDKGGPYFERGLIRIRETGEILKPPTVATCMYCGDAAPHLRCEDVTAHKMESSA